MQVSDGKIFILVALFAFTMVACQPEDVRPYAATETYPADTLLSALTAKRAIIVIAHDDDMCTMSGTTALLNQHGWEIAVVSLAKTPERDAAQRAACRHVLDSVFFVPLTHEQIRNDLHDGREPHGAIPRDSFDLVFNRSLIENEFERFINLWQPTVIFTLDNEIGGYGHPEHVLVSQMVLDLAHSARIAPSFIYQSVYTNHMENTIMTRHSERLKSWGFPGDDWERAKQTYGVDGMPEPTVQITITDQAQAKMDYLRSYNEREREVLGFFIPAFEEYEARPYFEIFDREFFRVIRFTR